MRFPKIAWTLSLWLVLSIVGTAQMPQRNGGPPGLPGDRGNANDNDPAQQQIARDAAKKANLDRQAALKNDTEKLVKLTAELKEYVDKSNANVLSLDVVKKAEEIEKLAKSVKEKMRGQY
jgi:hypothetical protein